MLKALLSISFFILVATVLPVQATTAATVHGQAVKAVAVEASAQKQYQDWIDRKATASADIRDMKAMDSWLDFQNRKYTKYIQKQEMVIAELERRKKEAKRIQMELEPFLETVVDQLEQFTKNDLPFLVKERTNRIEFLKSSLNDYRLALSEKLRRVFEALLIETEYGRNVSTTTQNLDIKGQLTQVSLFRLGRTALFYQTADGKSAGVWDKGTGTWVPLNEIYSRTLRRAKDMADRKRAVELLDLPIGAAR